MPITQQMSYSRICEITARFRSVRVLILGDLMLDHFIWGRIERISPEAPVPVVEVEKESFMLGGAANVAANSVALGGNAVLFGVLGRDEPADQFLRISRRIGVSNRGIVLTRHRRTCVKTRIIGGQQQVVRLDRELNRELEDHLEDRLWARLNKLLPRIDVIIVGDYGKGAVTQGVLNKLRDECRKRRIWISLDPKPTRFLDLKGLSLLTPNRREIFALAKITDSTPRPNPLEDAQLMKAATIIARKYQPSVLLVTLGELGMLVVERNTPPLHIGTVAKEVFDVSGAGDTVIAAFSLAIAAGALPHEAAIISNHAAGIVVGKLGTATVSSRELRNSFRAPIH